ncbi:MAG: hypothetical protein LJE64_06565 [Desulfofustis sp.]|jgi:hypothetical protein|nr:hypothetical protein [Desulfofustis sp.]
MSTLLLILHLGIMFHLIIILTKITQMIRGNENRVSMACPPCGTETVHKKVDYVCNNKILGDVLVPGVDVEVCPDCGDVMLPAEAQVAVTRYLAILEKKAITSLPSADLISAGQAAEILGITKQAFSKNPKIKKGFVYFTEVGTKKFFFRSSVELYKRTGDGRFALTSWKSSVDSGRIAPYNTADGNWHQVGSTLETDDGATNVWCTSNEAIR